MIQLCYVSQKSRNPQMSSWFAKYSHTFKTVHDIPPAKEANAQATHHTKVREAARRDAAQKELESNQHNCTAEIFRRIANGETSAHCWDVSQDYLRILERKGFDVSKRWIDSEGETGPAIDWSK